MLSSSLLHVSKFSRSPYCCVTFYRNIITFTNVVQFSKTCYHSAFQDSEISDAGVASAPNFARKQCCSYQFQEVRKCDTGLFRDDSIRCVKIRSVRKLECALDTPTYTR
jgi:hypothetical protein